MAQQALRCGRDGCLQIWTHPARHHFKDGGNLWVALRHLFSPVPGG